MEKDGILNLPNEEDCDILLFDPWYILVQRFAIRRNTLTIDFVYFQPMSPQEQWHWVHNCYGDDLGLTSSDDDYVAPPNMIEGKDAMKTDSRSNKVRNHVTFYKDICDTKFASLIFFWKNNIKDIL